MITVDGETQEQEFFSNDTQQEADRLKWAYAERELMYVSSKGKHTLIQEMVLSYIQNALDKLQRIEEPTIIDQTWIAIFQSELEDRALAIKMQQEGIE